MMTEGIKSTLELEFAIFCIEGIAERHKVSGKKAYKVLKESGILDDYIVPVCDVLHTQSKSYILDDICGVMRERGVEL
ncbi:MAG: DUF3791 domain-containing protein [Oscillospiraceae bacterium]|nr:DUF3791 domain-containing protein [Oscillospiraceae bacterium]